MKTSRLFILLVLSAATTALGGCAAPDADDASESSDDEIVRFPSSVFTTALPIAYGQTIPNVAFKVSDGFKAVRFQAKKGDRIQGKVDATSGKSIVYLARKQGATYVNVLAGGQGDPVTNALTHEIAEDDQYFLVFRTVPRTDATFTVSLASAGGAGACADAGQLPKPAELAAATEQGNLPQRSSPVVGLSLERRTCTAATGCGPATALGWRPMPTIDYRVLPDGAGWKTVARVLKGEGTEMDLDLATGTITGWVNASGVRLPVRGTASATCASVEESAVRVPSPDGVSYDEYRVVASHYTMPLPAKARAASTKPASAPLLTPVADEVVYTHFPRGQTTLNLGMQVRTPTSAGEYRECHPLTTCTLAYPVGRAPERSYDPCFRLLGYGANDLELFTARITPTGYVLGTSQGDVTIADGMGTFGDLEVRVSETQLQFAFPAKTIAVGDGVTLERGSATCTFPLAWQ